MNTTKTNDPAPRLTLRLQGIGLVEGTPVEDVRVGDRLVWNYGGVTEVLVIEPSATFKTFRVTERGGDGVERVRTMRRGRLVAVEGPRSRDERKRAAQAVIELRAAAKCPGVDDAALASRAADLRASVGSIPGMTPDAPAAAPVVTEEQKRTVACPKCKRVAGKPCRPILSALQIAMRTGVGLAELQTAHRERRAAYLAAQAPAPAPIDLMAQLRQALTGEGIDPRGVEQVAAKVVRDLAPGGIAGPAAPLGPVLPARCDKCIGGVAMVSKALPGDRGPVPLECPECGRGQVGARLQVGDGCTHVGFTDRYPYTVVEIISERRFVVQEDHAKRTDDNGMSESQTWAYSPNVDAPRKVVRLLKSGWKSEDGDHFAIGFRRRYHDFSF